MSLQAKNGKIEYMAKVRNKGEEMADIGELARAFLGLKSAAEFRKFIRDLCTLEEIGEMTKRFEAAQMLASGKTYRAVAKKTGLSTTTVARVAHWLSHGAGGYKLVLERARK